MNFDWQTIVVIVAVLAAFAYVARAVYQVLARRKACGACGTCPAAKSDEPVVVGIESLSAGPNGHAAPPPKQ